MLVLKHYDIAFGSIIEIMQDSSVLTQGSSVLILERSGRSLRPILRSSSSFQMRTLEPWVISIIETNAMT